MADNKHSQYEQYIRCESMSKLQSIISGKWKILILWYISFYKMQRFNELKRRLDG
ncbi:MAG: winged helix-turn-helix transcriptional regulator, partial [Eubacterium sp.]|nr:winged helix-turn-helix transcriptional regulator [Eubacterium sp.]